ncbi:hypothetical protein [Verrucomicrobium sp. GAS474]|uniref:hypothetical protein n=1 Tax=Verrucomicrobium sp. GAS474 TaxID=1882831 RepID=UPI000B88AEFF|nr:hypothetical protein [Verrucomicrobium sp. GAS474]
MTFRGCIRGGKLLFPLVLAAGLLLPAGALQAGGEKPKLVLRVYIQNEDPGSRSMPLNLTDPDQTIHINVDPEASERDLEAVEPYAGENGETGAVIHFSRHAGLLLNAVTIQKTGKILVVSLNGRIVYSPVIDTVINETLLIPRGVTPEDMALLQAMVKENKKHGFGN